MHGVKVTLGERDPAERTYSHKHRTQISLSAIIPGSGKQKVHFINGKGVMEKPGGGTALCGRTGAEVKTNLEPLVSFT